MTIDLISSLQKHGKKENISYILKMIIINNSERERKRENRNGFSVTFIERSIIIIQS